MSWHEADQLEGEYVGVGEAHELVPVPGHHLGDVEAGQEGHRYQVPEPKQHFWNYSYESYRVIQGSWNNSPPWYLTTRWTNPKTL